MEDVNESRFNANIVSAIAKPERGRKFSQILTPIFWRSSENFSLSTVVDELAQGAIRRLSHVGELVGGRDDASFGFSRLTALSWRMAGHDCFIR